MVIEIKRLRSQNAGEEIVITVEMREGEDGGACEMRSLLIGASQYATLNPKKGEITPEYFDTLEAAHKAFAAIKKSISVLSYGANSPKNLKMKLKQKGIDEESASLAVDYALDHGFIDERSDALRIAECGVRKNWSLKKIASHLFSKGYSDEIIREVRAHLEATVDFGELCYNAARSKCRRMPETPDEKKKLFAVLSRQGFSASDIRAAFEELNI